MNVAEDCNDGNNGATNATTKTSDGNSSFVNFAKELGCSTSQAADYAHEIDDALGSVGLPRTLTASTENDAHGKYTNQHGTENDKNIMSPHPAIFPATAASILRSKGNSHFP